MSKFVISFDQLADTIKQYETSITDFTQMIEELNKNIVDLQSSGWVSGASTEYFKKYDAEWKKNMEMHLKILSHLKVCLDGAKTDYEQVYESIPELGSSL